MKRCLAVTGTFLPYNDVTTQLLYKQLRLLPFHYDVCALEGDGSDPSFEKKISADPNYQKFSITAPYKYRDATFSIKNVNLVKALYTVDQYVDYAVNMYDGHDVVYTASLPCYTTRVGVALKQKHPNIKWIASFSDPINHSPYKYDKETIRSYYPVQRECFYIYIHYYFVDKDEADAFEQADLLLFICEEQRDFMIEQYNRYFHNIPEEEIRKKCVIVPLSYIPEWYETEEKTFKDPDPDTFVLAHFGRIYGLRIIKEFIYALDAFTKEHPDIKILVEQYGEFRKSDLKLIRALGLEPYFIIHDKYSYDEGYRKMGEADAVLLFDTIMPEDEIQPYLPSKVLEYSLLKKNVLAVTTPKSPTYRLMKQTDSVVCRYDRNDIKQGLEDIVINKKRSIIDYSIVNEDAVADLKKRLSDLDLDD
ncbi:MAG: hypothetical protein IKE28_08305 [Solobacterium sp.]|nr:hypothetical protein [Solobacterium sp.]